MGPATGDNREGARAAAVVAVPVAVRGGRGTGAGAAALAAPMPGGLCLTPTSGSLVGAVDEGVLRAQPVHKYTYCFRLKCMLQHMLGIRDRARVRRRRDDAATAVGYGHQVGQLGRFVDRCDPRACLGQGGSKLVRVGGV